MQTNTIVLLPLAAGVGFGLALLVATPAPAPLEIPPRIETAAVVGGAAQPTLSVTTVPAPPPVGVPETGVESAMPAAAEIRVQQLVLSFQARAQADFDNAEARARSQVRAELAKERAAQEDLARGGTMAFLKELKSDFNPPWVMLGSDEAFGALFEHKSKGVDVEGGDLKGTSTVGDGDVVRYSAGQFLLPVRSLFNRLEMPKDLVFVGAGMDETLLVLESELSPRGDVHGLTFRDMTIHCNDNYLHDLRHGPFTLRLERCRVIGFDMGAGGSSMLNGRVGAFFATDCRIEAGYGRAPGFGNLFDVRGALILRMVNCDIVGPFRSVVARANRSAQVFERCRFTKMTGRERRSLRTSQRTVSFNDCTFDEMTAEEELASRKRTVLSVTDINPTWRKPK